MVIVSSLEREFHHGGKDYHVLFEGKSQAPDDAVENGYLTIATGKGKTQYRFQKEGPSWKKNWASIIPPTDVEAAFLPWAATSLALNQKTFM